MNIQYCSDLHIDRFPGIPFHVFVRPSAPVLIVAGDICPVANPLYGEFLVWCRRNWRTIVVITGNHEYFCEPGKEQTFDEIEKVVEQTCKTLNIHFLQGGKDVRLPGTNIRIVGATLWSAIDPIIWNKVNAIRGDFKETFQRTHNSVRNTDPSDICALHALHKAQLLSAFAPKYMNETLIVVTHHMPSLKLLEERHKTAEFRSCYASADDDLFLGNVNAWICGHGHRSIQYKVTGGPLLLMNARGYENEANRITNVYNPEALFVVSRKGP
jgi:hypothetical protein